MTKSNSDEDRYCERMDFPNTFNEFAEQYGFTDKEEHYTNGSQLIPVFRVKQWLNHIPNNSENMTVEQYRARMIEAFQNADCNNLIALVSLPTEKEFEHLEWLLKNYYKKQSNSDEDCISRQEVNNLRKYKLIGGQMTVSLDEINSLPPVTPKPKTGHWKFIQRGKFIDICCSECGYVSVKDYAYNYTIDQLDEQEKKDFFAEAHMNFCECCGVKMLPTGSEKE